jgi:hypothetical protein
MAERRVPELAPALELAGQEPRHVVPGRQLDRTGVGLEGLDQHPPRRVAAAPPCELGQQLERPLVGAEVGHAEGGVGVDHRRERDAAEVVSLRDHLRPEQNGAIGLAEAAERRGEGLWILCRVGIEADRDELRQLVASSRSSRCVPAPILASSTEPQAGQACGAVSS